MKIPTRSLIGRLLLWFLLPSFLVVLVVVFLAYSQADGALRRSAFEKLEAVATVKEAALNTWVDHIHQEVIFVSEIPELARNAAALFAGAETPESARAYRLLSRLLTSAADRSPSLREVFLLSPTGGRVAVSTEEESVGQFRIYDRYYVEGKRAPFVQNVYPSPVTIKPTLTISAPIYGEQGELAGVLACHLALDYLDRSILQQTGLGPSGVVTLVDRHKVLVSGSHYGELTLGGSRASLAIDRVVEGESGAGVYRNLDRVPVLGVYRWLRDRELGLVVEMEEREALAPARRLAFSVLLLGVLSLGLLVVGTYFVSRRIAHPILAITDAALRVSGGDFKAAAPVATKDEIGTLAETFNRMVGQLAEKISQLKEAEKTLRERNAELERFNYTVSHDLKSPLVTIKGFLGFIEKDLESDNVERAREDLQQIKTATNRMHQLLDDLLELSRIGRVRQEPEVIPFAELAREAVDSVTGKETRERVRIEIAPDLPNVFGERIRLREVLENLIANAVKFMGDQPDPRVEVAARQDEDERVFYVRDNGAGIDPRYQDRVFNLFERLDPNVEGTGVGLAIVHRIVEVHGGRIWVESEGAGRGTAFCFTLQASP